MVEVGGLPQAASIELQQDGTVTFSKWVLESRRELHYLRLDSIALAGSGGGSSSAHTWHWHMLQGSHEHL